MSISSFRVLLLGDVHFGENYKTAGARVLADRGYLGGLEHLQQFTAAADTVVANLETPLVDPSEHPSPMEGARPFLHWGDPEQTVAALKHLGVNSVSLANNHMLDRGVSGLRTTFENLDRLGLRYFGAGMDLASADAPYRIALPQTVGGGQLSFQGSFNLERSKVEYGFYAEDEVPGCAPLSEERVESLPVPDEPRDIFRVAFPHWGSNYRWHNGRQRRLARELIRRGYHLVLGHGAHCLQEIERTQRHWAVYGIGNGHFQAGGRFKKMVQDNNILPLSFWVMLHVELARTGQRSTHLRLYPVYSDNKDTGYSPAPVSQKDFTTAVATLQGRARGPHTFDNEHMSLGIDDLGHFIRLEMGEWPTGRRPPRPPRNVTSGPSHEKTPRTLPGTDPLAESLPTSLPNTYDSPEALEVTHQHEKNRRGVGALSIARAAERDGFQVTWLGSNEALATDDERRVLISAHTCTESSLSNEVVADKHLTKQLLNQAGVSTPPGRLVHSAEDTVAAQRELEVAVVVKPRSGRTGRGITVNINAPGELESAYHRARAVGRDVLVEAFIDGLEYRCHATEDECVGAFRRVLPHVEGDGHSNVAALIQRKNQARRANPTTMRQPIPMDDVAEGFLSRHGLTWSSVLPEGVSVVVRDVNGITSGGDSEECLDSASDDLKNTAIAAVQAIPGMDWGGVDILIEHGTGMPYVMEVNTNASINGTLFPVFGQPRDTAAVVWSRLAGRAVPEAPRSVVTDEPHAPVSLSEHVRLPESWDDGGTAALDTLFQDLVSARGYEITRHSPRIISVTHHRRVQWFAGSFSKHDLFMTATYINRYGLLRRLLTESGVPLVEGKRVLTLDDFDAFVSGGPEDILLVPAGRPYRVNDTHLLTAGNGPTLATLPGNLPRIAQVRPTGKRLRTFATAQRTVLALGESRGVHLGTEQYQAAAGLAIDAVRAVPGLRWAAVDVVLPESAKSIEVHDLPLIEGMTLWPVLHQEDPVIFGSMDRLLEVLLET